MCGRFALGMPKKRLEELVGSSVPGEYSPSWNVAPGTRVPAQTSSGCSMFLWGLVPHWVKDSDAGNRIGMRLMNARSETVFDKPAFRKPVLRGRCLIPADAFYEWQRRGRARYPHAIARASGRPLWFAAVSDQWADPGTGKVLRSCCILTTRANRLMAPIHDRMPVIVREGHRDLWLDPSVTEPHWFEHVFEPLPPEELELWPVSCGVNKVGYDGPELLERLAGRPRQGRLF
ncbi:SOS response-associated peptidase [Salidesulfovibrio onnuriiensis]|uniref:SOS response-associated peptidase n=1 Tax=Salidesulfovibrio onnuriiensis TaxID=2583823 RepID=UPI0011CA5BFA|nr:SOS response-associated peptidase [Salidesulfovibrio onnuriiensis]